MVSFILIHGAGITRIWCKEPVALDHIIQKCMGGYCGHCISR